MSDNNSKIKIVYSGEDESYLNTVKKRYQSGYPTEEFEFITIFDRNPLVYQQKFIEILQSEPHIVYVDFSVNHSTQMKLATLLKRLNSFKSIPVVGLVHSKEFLRQCWSSGVDVSITLSGIS